MKHLPLQRFAAGLAAALYVLGGAQHWLVDDPCAHHDAALFEAGVVDAAHAGHHAHHSDASDASGSSESQSEDHGPCTCVGPCTISSPAALPSSISHAIAIAFEGGESVPLPPRDSATPRVVPFLLPYAHAPPALG